MNIKESTNLMQKITLILEPLTTTSFAPFGDVIEVNESQNHFPINLGTVERFHDLGTVDTDRQCGHPLISIVTCNTQASLPYTLPLLERHPLGSQCFMPLDNTPIMVVVAEKDESPNVATLRAFISDGSQGINYHAGIWHMPITFLQKDQRMLVVDRGGEGNNCDERPLPDYEIIIRENIL